jgi:putative oxidoreductase
MATKSITGMYQHGLGYPATKPASSTLESLLTYAVPAGRALFAALFLMAGLGHFSAQEIGYAAQAGVPFANFLVPFSGVLALAGGLSILLGYRARIGAALLFLFLVPVTFMMHKFWAETNPMMAQMQMAMFMKNVALIGTTLLITYFGAGPVSLDSRREAKLEQSK